MQRKQTIGYDVLQHRVNRALNHAKQLSDKQAEADPSLLKNLLQECEFGPFWQNYGKGAAKIFDASMEHNSYLKQAKDAVQIDELIKTRAIVQLLLSKLQSGSPDCDVIEYAIATRMLEQKIELLTALRAQAEGDDDLKTSFNICGTNKSIVIDRVKLA